MEHISQALARAFTELAPQNEEAQSTPHAPGLADQNVQPDFDTLLQKQQASLKAKFALLGWTLLELSDQSLLACRWDRSRHLADLRAASAFLRLVGGPHA